MNYKVIRGRGFFEWGVEDKKRDKLILVVCSNERKILFIYRGGFGGIVEFEIDRGMRRFRVFVMLVMGGCMGRMERKGIGVWMRVEIMEKGMFIGIRALGV